MKLTKENVYINLQGKTKEELTDLYNFLISVGEKPYRDLESFLDYSIENFEYIGFSFGEFCGLSSDGHKDKTEVTIEQLKEIIKPMENKEEQLIKEAKERGFLTEGNEFYSCFNDGNKIRVIKPYYSNSEINLYLDKGGYLRYYDGLNNKYDESLCSNPAIYKDGVWAEIVKPTETLQEKEQRLLEELEEVRKEIEEKNNIKIGDWVKRTYKGIEIFKADDTHDYRYINSEKRLYQKITNPELIKLLEQEIK